MNQQSLLTLDNDDDYRVSDAIQQIVDRLGQSKDRDYSLEVASENDGTAHTPARVYTRRFA